MRSVLVFTIFKFCAKSILFNSAKYGVQTEIASKTKLIVIIAFTCVTTNKLKVCFFLGEVKVTRLHGGDKHRIKQKEYACGCSQFNKGNAYLLYLSFLFCFFSSDILQPMYCYV